MTDPVLGPLLGTVDVARLLGLSVERVRQLDAELRPLRIGVGARRSRAYLPAIVDTVAGRRDARRAARAAEAQR